MMVTVEMSEPEAVARKLTKPDKEDSSALSMIKNVMGRFWMYALSAKQISTISVAIWGPANAITVKDLEDHTQAGLLTTIPRPGHKDGNLYELNILFRKV